MFILNFPVLWQCKILFYHANKGSLNLEGMRERETGDVMMNGGGGREMGVLL